MFQLNRSQTLPSKEDALPGRKQAMQVSNQHFVLGTPLVGPFPPNSSQALFGLGCFWGAERKFWELEGVHSTAAGYAGGATANPTYEEVCSGMTGHNEVVLIVFDPLLITYEKLLVVFFEAHDPTQGMRQGNDIGTQYRSGIYCFDQDQKASASLFCRAYGEKLTAAGFGSVTTEITERFPDFYYAEDYHQQYLAKNPNGYCGMGGTGVSCSL